MKSSIDCYTDKYKLSVEQSSRQTFDSKTTSTWFSTAKLETIACIKVSHSENNNKIEKKKYKKIYKKSLNKREK